MNRLEIDTQNTITETSDHEFFMEDDTNIDDNNISQSQNQSNLPYEYENLLNIITKGYPLTNYDLGKN